MRSLIAWPFLFYNCYVRVAWCSHHKRSSYGIKHRTTTCKVWTNTQSRRATWEKIKNRQTDKESFQKPYSIRCSHHLSCLSSGHKMRGIWGLHRMLNLYETQKSPTFTFFFHTSVLLCGRRNTCSSTLITILLRFRLLDLSPFMVFLSISFVLVCFVLLFCLYRRVTESVVV